MARITDYYGLLGVDRDASLREIKAAYAHLALQYKKETATTKKPRIKFTEIYDAFHFLTEPRNRKRYDAYLDYLAKANLETYFDPAVDYQALMAEVKVQVDAKAGDKPAGRPPSSPGTATPGGPPSMPGVVLDMDQFEFDDEETKPRSRTEADDRRRMGSGKVPTRDLAREHRSSQRIPTRDLGKTAAPAIGEQFWDDLSSSLKIDPPSSDEFTAPKIESTRVPKPDEPRNPPSSPTGVYFDPTFFGGEGDAPPKVAKQEDEDSGDELEITFNEDWTDTTTLPAAGQKSQPAPPRPINTNSVPSAPASNPQAARPAAPSRPQAAPAQKQSSDEPDSFGDFNQLYGVKATSEKRQPPDKLRKPKPTLNSRSEARIDLSSLNTPAMNFEDSVFDSVFGDDESKSTSSERDWRTQNIYENDDDPGMDEGVSIGYYLRGDTMKSPFTKSALAEDLPTPAPAKPAPKAQEQARLQDPPAKSAVQPMQILIRIRKYCEQGITEFLKPDVISANNIQSKVLNYLNMILTGPHQATFKQMLNQAGFESIERASEEATRGLKKLGEGDLEAALRGFRWTLRYIQIAEGELRRTLSRTDGAPLPGEPSRSSASLGSATASTNSATRRPASISGGSLDSKAPESVSRRMTPLSTPSAQLGEAATPSRRMTPLSTPQASTQMPRPERTTPTPGAAATFATPAKSAHEGSPAELKRAQQEYEKALKAIGQKDYQTAKVSLEWAVKLAPRNADYKARLSGLLAMLGQDLREARVMGKEAVELAPDNADCHYYLAVVYREAGLRNRATQSVERALALKPEHKGAQKLREKLAGETKI